MKRSFVTCDGCSRTRPVKEVAGELFGNTVVFGPGGAHDMFVIREDEAKCRRCIDEQLKDEIKGANVQ